MSPEQPVQDGIRVVVGNAQLVVIVDAPHQVGACRLVDDLGGHAEVARERPHLRLEQVAQRVDRGRVVGVPGEIAEQPLALVAGSQRQRPQERRLVENGERPKAGREIAAAEGRDVRLVARDVPVHGVRDVQGASGRARRLEHHGRVLQAFGRRGGVGQPQPRHVLRAEGAHGQVERDGRIHPPGHSDHDLLEAAPAHDLLPDELHQGALDELEVEVEHRDVAGSRTGWGRLGAVARESSAPGGRMDDLTRRSGVGRLPPASATHPGQRLAQIGEPLLQIGKQR